MTTVPAVSPRPKDGVSVTVAADIVTAVVTPAFVYHEGELHATALRIRRLADRSGCSLLYSLKALSLPRVLRCLAPLVDGYAASSVAEARLAREFARPGATVHLTTPALVDRDVSGVLQACDYVSFNSLGQLDRFGDTLRESISCGIRVNPQLSHVQDRRYDPCRPASKLGIPISALPALQTRRQLAGLDGLHFHSNCDARDFDALLLTTRQVADGLSELLGKLSWINLGGGYLFDEDCDPQPFFDSVELLRSRYDLRVFIEPGAAFVRSSCAIVASVVDVFVREGQSIAVLDTSVNHMPEVFEYQFEPDVAEHRDGGAYSYLLAGCTCLAGDVFGEYEFENPLQVGARLVFPNAGAYTLVKAHMFNGVSLPTIYSVTSDGVAIERAYSYEDFLTRCGG